VKTKKESHGRFETARFETVRFETASFLFVGETDT